MPVPSVITDLSATAASNSPAGTDDRTTADDYFRAHGAFIRQLYNVAGGTTALTASRAVVTDSNSALAASAVTGTELGYVSGVTSAIQTQLNAKVSAASPTFTGTVTTPLTASRAVVTGDSGVLAASAATATEVGYLSGVTSAIQTQLSGKPTMANGSFTPALKFGGNSSGMSYSAQDGVYVQVGFLVFFSIYILLSAKGSSTGDATITALPIASSSGAPGGGTVVFSGNMSSWGAATTAVEASGTIASLWIAGSSGTTAATHANFTDTSSLVIQGCYVSDFAA